MTNISKDFEALCEKEFTLARSQAYQDLDREIANIKARMAATGNVRSSGMARAVVDAVLARFDKVLAAFEKSYMGKWSGTNREFPDADYQWLNARASEKLDSEVREVKAKCNGFLWDASLVFAPFWDNAEVEARNRKLTILEKIEILRLEKNQGKAQVTASPVPASAPGPDHLTYTWSILHPTVVKIAKPRFESGLYADAVEAALKEVNDIVRQMVKSQTGQEFDGAALMNRAFSADKPMVILDDLTTTTGRSIQIGYMQIFAGAMTGIRNPKAHANIEIDATRALHFLFLASLLLFKIDERAK